jgi:virulence-associated protein VapD
LTESEKKSEKPVTKTEQVTKWTEIERTFDSIDDMNLRVYFLRDLISQMNICSDTQCEIYPALHQFKSHVKNLREYQLSKISDFKKIVNVQEQKRFIDLMRDLESESESVFSKIFALYSVKITREKALNEWHQRQIQIMKVQNESRLPISQEFVDDSQKYIDGVHKNIQDLDIFQAAKKKIETSEKVEKIEKKT